ncbi:helix-turn-helix domain-containing protein [Deinococcus sp. PESE-38]
MPRPRTKNPPVDASATRLRFAENVRSRRMEQQLTLEDLAERSGLTWSYLSQVERGIRNITVDNMEAIATGLGTEVRELL